MIKYFFILTFLVFACGEKPEETIELSDLIEGVGEEDTTQLEEVAVNYADSMDIKLRALCDSLGFSIQQIAPMDTTLYLEQFQLKANESWSLPEGNLHYFQYTDSLQCKNAFYNWMDGFGTKRQALTLWEETKISKRNEWVLVFEKEIIYGQGEMYFQGELILNPLFLERMEELKPKDRIVYALQIPAKRKTAWWIKENDKWLKRKKDETSK